MAVVLEQIGKRYAGTPAVKDVSVRIAPGTFFAVLGPSGCGKSTLLRLIAGLETLDHGRIWLHERLVAAPDQHVPSERRGVGMVFQSYALWPHMTVLDNIAFPLEAHGVAGAEARRQAERHLRTVAMTAYAARKPQALSGGQRQRVALARCLAGGATTVLMDEPLANLDPHLRGAMEVELAAFHRSAGATTLYITHDQREAMALADQVAVMQDGVFEQVGDPETVYARPATERVARFIGRGALLPGKRWLRPEDVSLSADGTARGRVIDTSYRGGYWEARVAVDALPEPLPITSRTRLSLDEIVPLALGPGWIIPN